MWLDLPTILLALLAALLLVACWYDWRTRTIPNPLNLAVALLAPLFWWASALGWGDIALQAGIALLVFALFAIAFAIGAMGGGDVKLLAALALWLPWQTLVFMLVVMSLAGGVLTLAIMTWRRLKRREGRPEIPYGLAIAFGGLWVISERFFYQFG
jgi:prepilin peptidase CpaA